MSQRQRHTTSRRRHVKPTGRANPPRQWRVVRAIVARRALGSTHCAPHTLGPTSESLPRGRISTAPVPTPYNGNSARARPALVDVRRQPSDTSRHWRGRCARPGTSQPTLHIDPTHRHRGRTWDCSAPMNRARPRPRPTGPPPRRQRPQNLPPRRAGTPRRVTLPPQTSQRDETRQQDGARQRGQGSAASKAHQPKGAPTPTRAEAEAARRERLNPSLSPKEQRRRDRRVRQEKRLEAMQAAERRPERGLIRDYVDSRWTFSEFLMPVFLIVMAVWLAILIFAPRAIAAVNLLSLAMLVAMLGWIIDSWRLWAGVKKATQRQVPRSLAQGSAELPQQPCHDPTTVAQPRSSGGAWVTPEGVRLRPEIHGTTILGTPRCSMAGPALMRAIVVHRWPISAIDGASRPAICLPGQHGSDWVNP